MTAIIHEMRLRGLHPLRDSNCEALALDSAVGLTSE
jgi:hypothetical protein